MYLRLEVELIIKSYYPQANHHRHMTDIGIIIAATNPAFHYIKLHVIPNIIEHYEKALF